MTPEALLEALHALAGEVGLPVQRVGRQPAFEGLAPSSSATCVVHGEVRVLLADSDPVAVRVAVLARALRRVAGERLEARFLPPAVRACLEEGPGGSAGTGSGEP